MTTEVPKIEIHNSGPSNIVIALLAMVTIIFLAFFAQKAWVNNNANQAQIDVREKSSAPSVPDFVINAEINTDNKAAKE
jgi:uncharacterized protein YggE